MKHFIPLLILAVCLLGCDKKNEPNINTHQPANPATWSPVNKTYISTDDSNYERYLNKKIVFFSRDSLYEEHFGSNYLYRLEYPLIYLGHSETPWLKFIDTLTITKAYEMSDESSCYKLVK